MSGKLIITHGIPGSGKSYWATRQVLDHPQNTVRANRDEIRFGLFGDDYFFYPFTREHEQKVSALQNAIIDRGLAAGKTVIVDDTNLNPKTIMRLFQRGTSHHAEICQKYFDTPVEICRKRNNARGKKTFVDNTVLDGMIAKSYGKNGHLKKFLVGEQQVYIYDTSLTEDERNLQKYNQKCQQKNPTKTGLLFGFDLDGTLIDDRREADRFLSDKKHLDFPNFYRASEFAPSHPEVLSILHKAQETGLSIGILTARDVRYLPETLGWLERNNIPVSFLAMRKPNDPRKSHEVKFEEISEIREQGMEVAHYVDDNEHNRKTFKNAGIHTTAIPAHNPSNSHQKGDYERIHVRTPFGRGVCIRCGRPLKHGDIGPECLKK